MEIDSSPKCGYPNIDKPWEKYFTGKYDEQENKKIGR